MRLKTILVYILFTGAVYSCGSGNGDGKTVDSTETLNNRYEDDTSVNNVNRALDQAVDTVRVKKTDTSKQ